MGLIERLARATARMSNGPMAFQYRRDTDPQMFRAPDPFDGPLPDPARNFNENETLLRWFNQVSSERGNMHTMLRRMATEYPEFTAVYLRMRRLGYEMRERAGTAINHDFDLEQVFDPFHESDWLSNRRIIFKLCDLYGILYSQMGPDEKLAALAYGDGQHGVYAYLQTFSADQPPQLVIDFEPLGPDNGDPKQYRDNRDIWTFYAACCLAKYLYDIAIYHGRGAPYEVIAPFDPRRHASFIPLTHSFAKGLLLIKERMCNPKWICGCNTIESVLQQKPEAHQWQTGELPGNVVRMMAHAAGYGNAAPPSCAMPYPQQHQRGMTPPRGTSGDLLRLYNEQRRRDTDPHLRRQSGGK